MRKLYKLTLLLIVILLGNKAMAYDFSAVCSTGQTLYYTITSDIEPYTVSVATENEEYPFYNTTPTGDLEIPESVEFNSITYSVTGLIDYALQHCNGLTSVTIPNSVTSIGAYAFYGCSGLSEITIPSSVTEIGDEAFVSCSGLTTVNFNAETSTGSSIFTGCSFTTLNIGENVKVIPAQAFMYCGGLTEVIISDSVTTIGDRAFNECSSLATLTIGKSVASIGNSVFINNSGLTTVYYNATNCATVATYNWGGCSSLTTLNIGESVKNIPDYLFRDCSGLTGTLVIPDSVTNIGASAFYNCSGYETLTLGKSVETIGNNAFYGCNFSTLNYNAANCSSTSFSGNSNITTITIGEDVETISNGAFSACTGLTTVNFNATNCTTMGSSSNPVFYNCTSLATINISEGVTNIPSYAFYQCSALTRVNYSGTITQWCGITFGAPGPLYDAHNLYINNSLVTDLVIPDIVTEINDYAFRGATCLTSVTIPESITNIGTAAFSSCSELTTVNFNAINCTTMGSAGVSVFSSCTSLSTLNIGDNVKNIPANAFKNCSGLETITIGNSIESIGDYAFYNCSGLTGITIPDSVTNIGSYAFSGCTGISEITIPNSVTSIGDKTFDGCTGLNTVNFNAENCTTAGTTNYSAFSNGTFTTLNIGNNVKNIPNYAFYNCSGLTEITIPDSVTNIGTYAFSGCSGLTTVNFNATNCTIMGSASDPVFDNCSLFATLNIYDNVKNIPSYAFKGCTGLTEITIPDSVTSIGDRAFYGCTGLSMVNFNAQNCTTMGGSYPVFEDCTNMATLNIGERVKNIPDHAFRTWTGLTEITIPDSVTSIGDRAFSGCTGLSTVNFNAQNCTTMGSSSNPVFYNCTSFATLNIGERVKSIPDNAFYGCTGLNEITIPDSVTSIGERAFYGCTGLTTVNFNAENCTSMGTMDDAAFNHGTFTTLNIGNNVMNIPDYAFSYCEGLTETLTIPSSVTSIGARAFYHCIGLSSLSIPESVTSISDGAFAYCEGLIGELVIPNSVITIGSENDMYGAFWHCSNLTSVTIGSTVETIGKYAFQACISLISIAVPDSVTSIRDWAFHGCTELTTVTIGSSVENIGSSAFSQCENITEIYITANTPPVLEGTSVFMPIVRSSASLYVPCNASDAYSSADGWSDITNIQERFLYELNVSSENEQQGTASITQQPTCSNSGIITATPVNGYRFLSWNDGNEDNPRTVIVTSDSTFMAGFRAIHTITATAGENGLIAPSGEITLDEGENQSFTITPAEDYRIASVLVDDVDATDQLVEGVYTFENVTANHTIEATFEEIPSFTITVSANNDEYGSVSGSGTYEEGAEVIITATPNEGYQFVSWSDDNTDNPRTITVTSDSTFVAIFEHLLESYIITVSANNDEYGSVAGGGTYDEGAEVVITAIPNEGYRFVSWDDENTDNPRTITVTSDSTFVAIFEVEPLQQYTITVLSNDEEYGMVSGGGTYDEGSTVIITAIPNIGYCFLTWSDGNTDNPREIVVTADRTYTAYFTASTHVEIDTTVTKYLSIYERTFYVAGQYSFVVPSAEGCDTIVDLNLRILDEPETYDISPNPAKSLISISSEDYISFVEFYSTAGRLVMRNEINAYSAEINVEALMPGVYFVRLYGEDEGLPSVQRFVKE